MVSPHNLSVSTPVANRRWGSFILRAAIQNYVKTLRVLLFNDESALKGGAERQVDNEQQYLERLGYTVRSVGLSSDTDDSFVDRELAESNSTLVREIAGLSVAPGVYRQLRSEITGFDPDIVHIHKSQRYPATVALATRGYPSIKTHHDYSTVCPSAWAVKQDSYEVCECGVGAKCVRHDCRSLPVVLGYYLPRFKIQRALERRLIDRHLAPSARLTEYLRDFGYDAHQLRNPETVRADGACTDDGFFFFIGRLSEEKGAQMLVEAVSTLRDDNLGVDVKIAGSGPLEPELRGRVDELDDDAIELLGYVSDEEKRSLLERARAVIVPSIWMENYPTVVLEAMAYGKPVIGSDRGGIGEMVTTGYNGLLYSATEPDQLASHIKRLAEDGPRAREMGENGREWLAENSSEELFGRKIRGIFHDTHSKF